MYDFQTHVMEELMFKCAHDLERNLIYDDFRTKKRKKNNSMYF